MACGLGGTSLINANVCLSPDPRVFEDTAWPQEVRRDRLLAEGFVRARHMLRPEVSPNGPSYEKVAALRIAASAFERQVKPIPLHVAYESGPNAAGVHQEACIECGDCCGGCNVGAKTTTLSTYIADAAAFGAEVFTGIRVLSLSRDEQHGWRVWAMPTEADTHRGHRYFITADIVVLAAGTLGSTEILLRSRAEGLALSDWLGSRFTVERRRHRARLQQRRAGQRHRRRPAAQSAGCAGRAGGQRADRPARYDRCARWPRHVRMRTAECLRLGFAGDCWRRARPSSASTKKVRSATSWRPWSAPTDSLIKGAYQGAVHNTQTFLAVGHDAGNGLMRLDDDRLAIEWTNGPQQRVFQRIEAALTTAAHATGGTYMRNPVSEKMLGGNLMTVHPLGGCTMGESSATGVVNHKGQVFDASRGAAPDAVHAGLYVCDGAVIPCPLGIHPLMTITALAERAMILLARDRGWQHARGGRTGAGVADRTDGRAAGWQGARAKSRVVCALAPAQSRAGRGRVTCGDCRSLSPS